MNFWCVQLFQFFQIRNPFQIRRDQFDVSSFARRASRSAILLVSDWQSVVVVRWFHDNSSQYFPNHNELYVWIPFGFCDGYRIFRKFFSVSCEVLVWHGFHWVARTCTTTAYRWLFRDSRPSLRIVLCCFRFTNLFCPQNRSLLFFFGSKHEQFSSVFVTTFDASPSESDFTLS